MRNLFRRKPTGRAALRPRARSFEPLEGRAMLAADIKITEMMYHPQSELDADEWIEIYNNETTPVALGGWKLSDGVDYTFPANATIGAGQYLVIAANTTSFHTRYPSVTNYIGGWIGSLSNGGETVEIEDASGDRANRFTYADEGDWATRYAPPIDNSYDGWDWDAPQDGFGKSMELVNRSLSNDSGENWRPSTPSGGTPGATNSVNQSNSAPLVLDVIHSPAIPRSTDPVTITARLSDELTTGLSATLFYRLNTSVAPPGPNFSSATMFDDGLHGDGLAGDGIYGATLNPMSNGDVVEYYVQSRDAANNTRTWPAPTSTGQFANALFQVDNAGVSNPDIPDYRLILTPYELQRFVENRRDSDAQMNATFISVIDGVTEVRYLAGVRYRGNGSRSVTPPNQRVNFADDRPWYGETAVNFNSRFTYNQFMGMSLFEQAGLPAEHATRVQLRRNGSIMANAAGEQYGSYVQLDVIDDAWAEDNFPGDSSGNAYRAGGPTGSSWTLNYRGETKTDYNNRLTKATNVSEDDWSDIIALGKAFDSQKTPDAQFMSTIEENINVQEWLRWLAVNALLVNEENGLINNFAGDEYSLYRGVSDQRFSIVIHDLDNVMGLGDQGGSSTTRDLFEPAANPALGRLLNNPTYRSYYFAHLKQLAQTVFSAAQLNPWLDANLGNWVSASMLSQIKNFAAQRVAYVLSQIPAGTPNLSSPQDTLRITELMYNAKSGNDADFIEFRNTGPATINLQGVTISGAVEYVFGNVNLAPNQYIVVAGNLAAFRARYGQSPNVAGEYSGNLNNSSEEIVVQASSPLFSTILDFTYSDLWQPTTDGEGKSLVIVNPSAATSTWGDAASWRASVMNGGSPGADDVETIAPNTVVINEVLTNSTQAIGDRIEIRNLTGQAVNLSNYYISNDSSNRTKYRFPAGTTIAAGGYLAISQQSNFGVGGGGNTAFNFSEAGDDVYLTAPNGIITIDSIDVGASLPEVSFGRHTTSTGNVDYPAMTTATFGSPNSSPKIGPVIINEVNYHPAGSSPTDIEFIELKNVSASTVQLFDPARPANTWAFTEGVDYQFPAGVTIPANGFIVVVPFDPIASPATATAFRADHNMPAGVALLGPFSGVLDSSGEKLELSQPGVPLPDTSIPMIAIDRVTYDDVAPWPLEADGAGSALGRKSPAAYANDPASWDATRPSGSPGRENTFLDRTPPTSPTNLAVSITQPGSATLSWTAAVDFETDVASYNIYRDNQWVGISSTTSYIDTRMAPRLRFNYEVSAVNSSGLEGPRSPVLTAGYAAIDAVWSISDTELVVMFTDTLDPVNAGVKGNYTLAGATISSAAPRPDGRSVTLTTSALTAGNNYALSVANLQPTTGNVMPAGTSFSYTHEALVAGTAVRMINPVGGIAGLPDADLILALPTGSSSIASQSSKIFGRVNLVDGAGGAVGHFTGDSSFPAIISPSSPLVVRATGIINLPASATWTFGITANAAGTGRRLRIDGADVIPATIGGANADLFGTVNLGPGEHFVDLTYYSMAGSAGIELFAAAGSFTSFAQSPNWNLLGDAAGAGGLTLRTAPLPAIDLAWTAGAVTGSMITQFNATTAAVEGGASIRYKMPLVAGQALTVLATPTTTMSLVGITVRRGTTVVATATASAAGATARIDNFAATAGSYTIELTASSTSTINLSAVLNTSIEAETYGLGGNDSRAAAQSIESSALALPGDRSRLAVTGSINLPGVYSSVVAADNPVGYWRLNEAAGSSTASNTGSAGATGDGTYFGGPTLGTTNIVPNLSTTATSFDGVNDRVEISDQSSFSSGGPYFQRTVELWFNATDVAGRHMIFDEGNSLRGLNIYLDGGKLYVGAYNTSDDDGAGTDAPWGPIYLDTTVAANTTYHVTAVLNGTTKTFTAYLNGVQYAQSTAAGPLYSHNTGIRIGRRTETRYHDGIFTLSGHEYAGKIAEVSLYNTALTASKVAAHYLAGSAKADDYYSFNLTAGQSTTLGLDGVTAGTWTVELQNAAGDVVATGIAGGTNFDAVISNFSPPATGTYYARITSTVSSNYTLVVARGADLEREANDTIATANDITGPRAVLGGLNNAVATDMYRVTLAAGAAWAFQTATPDGVVGVGGANWNPRLELQNSAGVVVASNDNGAPDGRNALMNYTAAQAGDYYVRVVASAGSGDYVLTATATSAPTANIVDVVVHGTDWTAAMTDYLTAHQLGAAGWSIVGPAANVNLPWDKLNQISILFDSAVNVTAGDLSIFGIDVTQYGIAAFTKTGNRATWTLDDPILADTISLQLSSQLEAQLGGQDRQFIFEVLAGDVNNSGIVAMDDLLSARNTQFENTTTALYDPIHDIDGNGVVSYTDLIRIRNRLGAVLPHAGPSPAAPEAIVALRSDAAPPIVASTSLAPARRPLAAASVDRVLNHSTIAPTVASSASLQAARTRAARAHAVASASHDAALAEADQSLSVVRRRR